MRRKNNFRKPLDLSEDNGLAGMALKWIMIGVI